MSDAYLSATLKPCAESPHSTLVLAATDTTTNALSRILHVLAMHPDEQQKLRTEITQARHGERVSYDSLMNLPYLDAVIRESLRLYVDIFSHLVCADDS